MTTTTDTTSKVKRNAEIAAKSIHTYVVGAVSFGASILLALGPDWVTAFIQAHPALSVGAPFVGLAFVLLAQVAPQSITLSADRQKAVDAARAWVLDLASKAMPGQPMAVPPAIAKAVGLPDVVHAPINPAPVDVSLPMPGTAVMVRQPVIAPPAPVLAAAAAPAVEPLPDAEPPAAPAAFDLRGQFAQEHPEWTAPQLDAAVVAYRGPRP